MDNQINTKTKSKVSFLLFIYLLVILIPSLNFAQNTTASYNNYIPKPIVFEYTYQIYGSNYVCVEY
jgi:hypothetical protein